MASLNKVILVGNLTRDPELKYTPSGTAVVNLGLAVNRRYTVNGEKREEVLFITCVAWGKTAEACGEYLHKGSSVLVEGRLQSREWETKDGQKRTVIEVTTEFVQFLDGRKSGDGHGTQESKGDTRPATAPRSAPQAPDDEVPF